MKREIVAEGVVASFAEYPLAVEAHGLLFVSGVRGGRPGHCPTQIAELPEDAQALSTGYGLSDMVEGPVVADAWTAFENLTKALRAAGSDQAQILRLHIWQQDKRFFPLLEKVRMVWQPVPCPSSGLGVRDVCGRFGNHFGLSAIAALPGVSATYPGRDVVRTFDNADLPSASFYSQAVRSGPLVFLAGHIPIQTDRPGKPPVRTYDDVPEEGRAMATGRSHPDSRHGPIAAQTWYTYDEIRKNLAAQRLAMEDIVQLTIFLADLRDFPDFLRVHRQFFPEGGPAITVTGFDEVGHKGTLLEIEPVAVHPDAGLEVTSHRWPIPAPMPGAAAVTVDKFCFLSGMIGLTGDGVLARSHEAIQDADAAAAIAELERFERVPGLATQCWAAFERLAETLETARLSLGDLVKITVFMAEPEDFQIFESVRRLWISENLPAMEGIVVFGPGPVAGAHVQIEAIAAHP